jgi:CheY-like chemotaxis protein
VHAGIEHQLGGSVTFNWLPSGLHCKMLVPHVGKSDAPSKIIPAWSKFPGADPAQLEVGLGDQILLVEDEPLIAMMLSDMLTELGFRVEGPHGSLADAIAAAKRAAVQAAVLDVNLAGEKIYPVAEILRERNIPFVFISGYGHDSIDPRFKGVTLLQKPIERQKLRNVLRGAAQEAAGSGALNARQARSGHR